MPELAPNISTPSSAPGFIPGVRADPIPPPLSDADFGDHGSNGAAGGKPAEYKAELPADLKLPEGVNFKFDDKDAVHGEILVEARKLAHDAGLDQTTFSKLLGLHARLQLREHDGEIARVNIEKQSITGFEARSSAVISFLDRHLSTEQSRAIQAGVHDRHSFEALEALIAKATGRAPPTSTPPSSEKPWADRMWPNGFTREGGQPAGRR